MKQIELLEEFLNEAKNTLSKSVSLDSVEKVRISFLGKKGKITEVLRTLGSLSIEAKKEIGPKANKIKEEILKHIAEKQEQINQELKAKKLQEREGDPSVSSVKELVGALHPLSVTEQSLINIFFKMGYTIAQGPEIEEELFNFDLLNFPKDHPAKDDHDSFFIDDTHLMRTHTSPVQARFMRKNKPPFAIIAPGRCYRRDTLDATHSHTFHQIEGLVVDKGVTFADLKGTLLLFAKLMFGSETKIRLRPDFFPFTEPSAELAVSSPSLLSGRWVEIAGCGMVDPEVFKKVGYDPNEVQGFAFGMGIERIAMVQHGVQDIRHFYENDIRFIKQFK